MVHELYALMALACALVISILIWRTITIQYSSTHKKSFIALFSVSFTFCIIDALWGVFASHFLCKSIFFLTFFSYTFHLGATFTIFYWFKFNIKFISHKSKSNVIINIIAYLLLTAAVILIISNFFEPTIFIVNNDCIYETKELRNILFIIQYILFGAMFIISLISKIRETDEQKKKTINISISYSIIPLLSGCLQLLCPDLPVYSFGFMYCCLIMYIFVITTENERLIAADQKATALMEYQTILQRNYSIISSLAGNYDFVCLINCSDNIITILSVSGIFEDFIAKSTETIPPKAFDSMLKSIIPQEDFEEFLEQVDRRKIMEAIKNGERVTVEVRMLYNNKDEYYRLSFASDKDNSNNVLLGIKNMQTEFVMRQELEKQKNYISNLELQNEIATFMASIDGLTGLLNKISFIEKVERYLAEKTSKNCALLFFDMDHFKSINDVFGHDKGDEALREMSTKLKALFRSNELISRMGGDEFCIFLPDISYEIVEKRICLMNEKLKAVYSDENATIKTSASIGCVYCNDKNLSYVEMHSIADAAMYEVKDRGRDGHEIKIV